MSGPSVSWRGPLPNDISIRSLPAAWGNMAVGRAAAWVVWFCQTKNNNTWEAFRLDALYKFYADQSEQDGTDPSEVNLNLGGLTLSKLIVVRGKDCIINPRFVQLCYQIAPATAKR